MSYYRKKSILLERWFNRKTIWKVTLLRSDRISHIYCEREIPKDTSFPSERNEIEQFTFPNHNACFLLKFIQETRNIESVAWICFSVPSDYLTGFAILLVLHSLAFPNINFLHIYHLLHLLVTYLGDFVLVFICWFVFKQCYRTLSWYSGKTGFDAIFTLQPKFFITFCLLVH